MAKRRDGTFECSCVRAADVQRIAEGDGLLHARSFTQFFGQMGEIRSVHRPSR